MPLASYQIRKIAGLHAPGMPWTFFPPSQVSDSDMHHGTCVTHVPWCMPGSLTTFPLKSVSGKGIPVACANRNFTHLVRGPWTEFESNTHCPASRTTLVATRFRVAVICPIIQVPHCIRVFFYFVWFVFINHIFQFYYELCTYCNILDIYLS